jgi:predicted nucleic acid-binding protein
MSAESDEDSFVDTNIFLYRLADDDPRRSPIAAALIDRLVASGALRTSTQVLQELYVNLVRKARVGLSPDRALRYLDEIAQSPVWVNEYSDIRRAVQLTTEVNLSFWDALIVVAAANSGAKRLYSEDMQDGRVILGVRIVNPFREPQ